MSSLKPSLLIFLLIVLINSAYGQFYPIQVTPQLVPPYSVYLADYATPGNEKLRVIMVQRDLTQPSYQVRLVMSIEWNGRIIMRTARSFNPAPINLSAGVPTVISGSELAPYLDSRNIDFVGYNREQYERTKSLPEGSFQIIFTAYDYRRQDVQVSNTGTSFYYLMKSEPPLVNFPACGTTIPMKTPQQIIFSWLPRNTGSPNSASRTVYEFALYETRPEGRNPNDVVLSTQPVFKTTTELTQLIYGPAEPMLLDKMKYVWRVRATDENGRDAFRNNGYSEVCTFTYGGIDPTFNIGVVENLQAVGETERKGKITWTKGDYDSYKVYYKKTGASYTWFSSEVTTASLAKEASTEGQLKLYDLEPDTEYETRVQVKKSGVLGPYSEIVKFRTTPLRVAVCGEQTPLPEEGGAPLLGVIKGTVIDVDGIQMTIMDATSAANDGWYKGYAKVSPLVLGAASYTVQFERLFIREDRRAGFGRIDILSKGVAAMVEEQLAAQTVRREERQEQQNRDMWAGVAFYDKIFAFDNIAIDTMYSDPYGNITMVDANGQSTIIPEIPAILTDAPEKAVIVQDKNGDQWVVQKEGSGYKTTKVEGGGLPPLTNMPVSDEDISLLKKALAELKRQYDDANMNMLRSDLESKKAALLQFKSTAKSDILAGAAPLATAPSDADQEVIILPAVRITNENDEFSALSSSHKEAERNYNTGKVARLFAQDTNKKEEYRLIIQSMEIEKMRFNEFIAKRKSENIQETVIASQIKDAIVSLIMKTLDEKY